MNGRPENLAFLWRSMQLVPAVQRTQALCVQAQDEDLERIFRHHATEPIRRRDELDQRADMDWCLGVWGFRGKAKRIPG